MEGLNKMEDQKEEKGDSSGEGEAFRDNRGVNPVGSVPCAMVGH